MLLSWKKDYPESCNIKVGQHIYNYLLIKKQKEFREVFRGRDCEKKWTGLTGGGVKEKRGFRDTHASPLSKDTEGRKARRTEKMPS